MSHYPSFLVQLTQRSHRVFSNIDRVFVKLLTFRKSVSPCGLHTESERAFEKRELYSRGKYFLS
jgi:hypothetical protein